MVDITVFLYHIKDLEVFYFKYKIAMEKIEKIKTGEVWFGNWLFQANIVIYKIE